MDDEEAVITLGHIIEENKKHVAELLRPIHSLDLGQADEFKEIL